MGDSGVSAVADPAFPAMLTILRRLRAQGWTSKQATDWLSCVLDGLGAEGFRAWVASDPELPFVRDDDPGGWHTDKAERSRQFHERLQAARQRDVFSRRRHAPSGSLCHAPRPIGRPRERRPRSTTRATASRGDPHQQGDDDDEINRLRATGREAGMTHISEPLEELIRRLANGDPA